MTVRELLRRHRETLGHSRRRVSHLAGLSDSVVGKIESGEIQPSLRAFARIAAALQLNDREIALLVRLAAVDKPSDESR